MTQKQQLEFIQHLAHTTLIYNWNKFYYKYSLQLISFKSMRHQNSMQSIRQLRVLGDFARTGTIKHVVYCFIPSLLDNSSDLNYKKLFQIKIYFHILTFKICFMSIRFLR
jgi:hypothetical protein